MALQVSPITPHIGAEVSGVDLAKLTDGEFKTIHKAFLDHLVLFFRDQDLSVDEHIEFGRRFGPLHIHPAARDYHNHNQLLRRYCSSTPIKIRSARLATLGIQMSRVILNRLWPVF